MKATLALALCLLCGTASFAQADSKVCFTEKEAGAIHDRLWAGDKAMRELAIANDQLENRNESLQSAQVEADKAGQAAREAAGKLGAAIAARQVSDDRVTALEGTVAVLDIRVGRRFRLGLGIGGAVGAAACYGAYRLTR